LYRSVHKILLKPADFEAVQFVNEPPVISKDACPVCGAFAGHKPAIRLRESHNYIALLFGGIPGLVLVTAGREKRVQCNACGARFSIRPTSSKICLLIFWLLIAPLVLVCLVCFLHFLWTTFATP